MVVERAEEELDEEHVHGAIMAGGHLDGLVFNGAVWFRSG